MDDTLTDGRIAISHLQAIVRAAEKAHARNPDDGKIRARLDAWTRVLVAARRAEITLGSEG
jgi:hypothetical protein